MGCKNERLHKEMLKLGCYVDPAKRFIRLNDHDELCIGGVFVVGEIERILQAMKKVSEDA